MYVEENLWEICMFQYFFEFFSDEVTECVAKWVWWITSQFQHRNSRKEHINIENTLCVHIRYRCINAYLYMYMTNIMIWCMYAHVYVYISWNYLIVTLRKAPIAVICNTVQHAEAHCNTLQCACLLVDFVCKRTESGLMQYTYTCIYI